MDEVTQPNWISIDDYVEYWAAGRLNVSGGNPYNPEELLPLQQQAGRFSGVPVMMWNPPWMMAIVMPFGAMDYALGRTIWLLCSIVIIVISSDLSWSLYGGKKQTRWISWIIGLSFIPVLDGLRVGQTGSLLLLGVVGFLYFYQRKSPWIAGAFLALLAVKPQILFIFALAVLFWVIRNRVWPILISASLVLTGALILAGLTNHSVIQQYFYALIHHPPDDWATPTIGGVLRSIFGIDFFWMQFFPTFVGIIWLCIYWNKKKHEWNWTYQAPILILVSLCSTAYGWIYDQPAALVAIISIFALIVGKKINRSSIVVIISYCILISIDLLLRIPQHWLWWFAPSILAWYLISRHFLLREPVNQNFVLD
jgi:hypothetical protein